MFYSQTYVTFGDFRSWTQRITRNPHISRPSCNQSLFSVNKVVIIDQQNISTESFSKNNLKKYENRNRKQEVLNETKLSTVAGNGNEQNPEIVICFKNKKKMGRTGMKIYQLILIGLITEKFIIIIVMLLGYMTYN